MGNRKGLKVVAVIILLVASNYISWNIGKSGSAVPAGKIIAAGGATAAIPGGMRAIGGTVDSVSDVEFILKVPSFDPSSSGGMSTRTVAIDQATIIERLIQKDSATIQKEQSAFMEQIQKIQNAETSDTTSAPIVPPEPFKREKISLKDLKAGDMVSVTANEDISKAKKFVAVRVSLQPRVSVPSVPKAPAN